MQFEHEGTVRNDFTSVGSALTQGLRDLPTDYIARVQKFLAEYLDTPEHPVPFGGRLKDFEDLDAWLADASAAPYLLLAASAGRGKSALLARWCQRLLAHSHFALVYFPVSIRFRTNLAGVVFPSLVALLANLHGEKVPLDPNTREEVWRGLFADYVTRPLPDGRALLLILDGVDEAADWSAGPGLFPANPSVGLRVVLSARSLANDQDPSAWLKRLDWMRPGLARTLELYPLDRNGIANVLQQMGFPLDLLGSRIDIVSELYRLSEGDPLLVRLYVDDLWARGEAAARLRLEDLRAIHPGLSGYFERWWEDQRLLWREEAAPRQSVVQTVLNLLAAALGPLSKEDILNLMEGEGAGRQDFGEHLATLARFVTGDGERQGYVFSHPRLGNYFLEERMGEEERRKIEQRYLDWGARMLAALNAGSLVAEGASSYIVQYYGVHLERAGAEARELLPLISDGWRRAWEKLDRANAGFIGDVERAWSAAGRQNAAALAAGDQAPFLGEEIRSLLIRASVNSINSNISPRLMLEAVKTGIWTPAQGLACIRLITDLTSRARELVNLAPSIQGPLRLEILHEAFDTAATIKDEYARLDAIVELAPAFPEELLWQVLESIRAIEDEADQAGALAELVPALAPYPNLLEKALGYALNMEEEEYQVLALEGLAPSFSSEQSERILQYALAMQEERYRAQILVALLTSIHKDKLEVILQEARDMHDGLASVRLLVALTEHLPERQRDEVVQEVLELERDIDGCDALIKLAPYLSQQQLQQALQKVQRLWDENEQADALIRFLPYIGEEQLSEFQRAVMAIRSEEQRIRVIAQLLPRLSENQLGEILSYVRTLWDEGRRVELLAQLAQYMPDAMLSRLIKVAGDIEDRGYGVWLLAELEVTLGEKLQGIGPGLLTLFQSIRGRDERLQTLLAIVARLSPKARERIFEMMLPEIFNFALNIRSEEEHAHVLTKLSSYLPKGWLPAALKLAGTMRNEVYQTQAMLALAAHLDEGLFADALEIVRGIRDWERRALVLDALIAALPQEKKGERVQEMLQVLQVIKDEEERVQLIINYASLLPEMLSPADAQITLVAVQALRDERRRVTLLKELLPHLSVDLFDEVLAIVRELTLEEGQSQLLDSMAHRVPEPSLHRFLDAVQELHIKQWKERILATLVAHLPKSLLEEMLQLSPVAWDWAAPESDTALSESPARQLRAAIQEIVSDKRHVSILGALLLRIPESYFPRYWETMLTFPNERLRFWNWQVLVPHMSESLFSQTWKAAQEIADEEQRVGMLRVLSSRVPESTFPQVWETTRGIRDVEARYTLLSAQAAKVPQDFFELFLEEVEAVEDAQMRYTLLVKLASCVPQSGLTRFLDAINGLPFYTSKQEVLQALAPAIPEGRFEEVWQVALAIPHEHIRTSALLELASQAPVPFFATAWRTLLELSPNVEMRRPTLRKLLPHLVREHLAETLALIQALPRVEQKDLLDTLVASLAGEQYVEAYETLSQGIPDASEDAGQAKQHWLRQIQATFAPYLPEERREELVTRLLQEMRALRLEEERAWLLERVVQNLPEGLLGDALEEIGRLEENSLLRADVLRAFLSDLSAMIWKETLKFSQRKMQVGGDVTWIVQLIQNVSPDLMQSDTALLYSVLHEIFLLLAQDTRREALLNLASLAHAVQVAGGERAVVVACNATLETGTWWP